MPYFLLKSQQDTLTSIHCSWEPVTLALVCLPMTFNWALRQFSLQCLQLAARAVDTAVEVSIVLQTRGKLWIEYSLFRFQVYLSLRDTSVRVWKFRHVFALQLLFLLWWSLFQSIVFISLCSLTALLLIVHSSDSSKWNALKRQRVEICVDHCRLRHDSLASSHVTSQRASRRNLKQTRADLVTTAREMFSWRLFPLRQAKVC